MSYISNFVPLLAVIIPGALYPWAKGALYMVIKYYYYYYELPGWCQIGQQWYHTSPSLASLTRPVHTLLYNPINKIHSRGWLRWPLGGRVTFSQLRLNNAMVALTYLLPARPGLLFLPIAPSIVPIRWTPSPSRGRPAYWHYWWGFKTQQLRRYTRFFFFEMLSLSTDNDNILRKKEYNKPVTGSRWGYFIVVQFPTRDTQ